MLKIGVTPSWIDDAMYNTLVACDTLAENLDNADWRIVDCRFDLADPDVGARAFAAGHIPGARYADLNRVLSGPVTATSGRHPLPDPEQLRDWLGRQGIGNRHQVVAYDSSGGAMAVRLWWLLRWLGHDRVALLDGGWPGWLAAGLPQQTGETPLPPEHFDGQPRSGMQVTATEVQRALGDDAQVLIDARSRERYRGEQEPIDPLAGRIAGALNLPFQEHLKADGTFKTASELRALYRSLLGDCAAENLVAYCGSGVSACHNLLAMEIAGLCGARLYVGSWSEWIRDPSRPTERG